MNLIKMFIIAVGTMFMMAIGCILGINHFDTSSKFLYNVYSSGLYENSIETAVPQTKVYDKIENHFKTPPKPGKTSKKAIFIGYDGSRADNAKIINPEQSAITEIMNDGGSTVLSYCGGVNYPEINTQDTSTAPGWCTMLTGQWADVHGVYVNDVTKTSNTNTMITTLLQDKLVNSTAFYTSWKGHFIREGATYLDEKKYCEDNNLNATFSYNEDDNAMVASMEKDIAQQDCSDFIFGILEYCDHAGHNEYGFGFENPNYYRAFQNDERQAKEIIQSIKNRPTYNSEDWLILISSDHGGYNTEHGSYTLQERITFITSNQ